MQHRFLLHLILTLAIGLFASCNDKNEPSETADPGEPIVTESQITGEAVAYDPLGTTPKTRQNRIIYEMDLLSFTSAGTLSAAQDRLEEVHSLGIDIVWLMPIHPRGDAKFATYPSPYAPKDYYAVWSKYGTTQDLAAFVSKAHTLGMEVWLDWVPNHTGTSAVWVTEHPEYYVWEGGQIKHPNDYSDVLQLAMGETATQNAMIDAMKYWIDNADIDGFRCDYVSSSVIPADFWKRAIPELKNHKPGKNITVMGEADFADQVRLYDCGFDFDYAWKFNTFLKQQGAATTIDAIRRNLKALYANVRYKDGLDRMMFLTNHDDNEGGKNYWQTMTANIYPFTVLEFTAFGMPLIYNGQEVGHRAIIYPWEKNTIGWNSPNKKMQNTIRTLCALKHTQPALCHGTESQRGTFTVLDTDNDGVLAYCREKDGNRVIVILNLGDAATVTVSGITAGKYLQWLDSETIANGTSRTPWTMTETLTMQLAKKGYAVFASEN